MEEFWEDHFRLGAGPSSRLDQLPDHVDRFPVLRLRIHAGSNLSTMHLVVDILGHIPPRILQLCVPKDSAVFVPLLLIREKPRQNDPALPLDVARRVHRHPPPLGAVSRRHRGLGPNTHRRPAADSRRRQLNPAEPGRRPQFLQRKHFRLGAERRARKQRMHPPQRQTVGAGKHIVVDTVRDVLPVRQRDPLLQRRLRLLDRGFRLHRRLLEFVGLQGKIALKPHRSSDQKNEQRHDDPQHGLFNVVEDQALDPTAAEIQFLFHRSDS